MKVAIIGAGWAGLAAAVAAVEAGHQVTLHEAARTLGGRARSLDVHLPDGTIAVLDNGQHIMIGAYTETLRLMAKVGAAPRELLLRLPLALRFPDGTGLALPDLPAPIDALAGILAARGWNWRDKLSLLLASTGWQLRRFDCPPATSVTDLCWRLTPRVMDELIEPLCVSALNTPAARSSGQVFLRVIRDSLFGRGYGGWGGSNLLLPRASLGQLLPEATERWLSARGATLRTGHRVQAIAPVPGEGKGKGGSAVAAPGWTVDGAAFDRVILACPPWDAARLVETSGITEAADTARWLRQARALTHEAITTVYALGQVTLPLPMLALRSGPGAPAQYVFDRAQLGGPAGLLAFVISASVGERDALQAQVLAQAAALGWNLRPVQTVVEKRATFACTPGVQRPGQQVAPGLLACGDYVQGPYPATLEGAVRSGFQVSLLI